MHSHFVGGNSSTLSSATHKSGVSPCCQHIAIRTSAPHSWPRQSATQIWRHQRCIVGWQVLSLVSGKWTITLNHLPPFSCRCCQEEVSAPHQPLTSDARFASTSECYQKMCRRCHWCQVSWCACNHDAATTSEMASTKQLLRIRNEIDVCVYKLT